MRPPTLLQNGVAGGGGVVTSNSPSPVIVSPVEKVQTDQVSHHEPQNTAAKVPLAERAINGSTTHFQRPPTSLIQHNIDNNPPVMLSSTETPNSVLTNYLVSSPIADAFDVEHDLGKGRFAVVRSCRCRQSGSQYAAKVLRKSRMHMSRDAILQEVFVHHRACRSHPRIAKLFHVFEAPRELVMVME